ncbi:MAG: hypothetical protein ACTSQE_16555 [Candidatus Heimdallarchaeaceae archaeon]
MIQMYEEEPLVKMTGTKLSQSEYDYLLSISKEKKWSVAQVLREIVRESMKQEVKAVA